ncbi:MAG TPA: transporter substrate-binding domain-containing protein [Chitinophagaceae bacterium]|nr:transporter substrate-binding domain-containing protein [Chitinophagaceae bacterium]
MMSYKSIIQFTTNQKKINMRRISVYLLISFLVVLISVPAFSQKVLSTILKKGEIRIGTTGNQPPFSMKAKNGELIGYEVDLANALAKNMGVKLKLVEMPFSDLLGSLKAGKIDAVMSGMTMTPERNLEVLFAGPYTLSGKSILTKATLINEISAATAATEKKYKIASLKGSTSVDFVKNYMPKHELILIDNYNDGVAMVLSGKADALVADKPICVITLMKNPGRDLVISDKPLTIEPIGMALPSDDPQFLNLAQNYITSLQLSGTLQILEKKWFQDGTWMLNVE